MAPRDGAAGAAVPCRMPSAARRRHPAEPSAFNILTSTPYYYSVNDSPRFPLFHRPRKSLAQQEFVLFLLSSLVPTTPSRLQQVPKFGRGSKGCGIRRCTWRNANPASGPALMPALTEHLLPSWAACVPAHTAVHTAEISSTRSSQLKAVKSIAIHSSNVCFARFKMKVLLKCWHKFSPC